MNQGRQSYCSTSDPDSIGSLLCFPQTVEIAVFIGSDNFVAGCESKDGNRLFSGLQLLALTPFLRLQQDPLNVVGLQHGMLCGADRDSDELPVHTDHRDMLFTCRIGGVGFDGLHLLAAAADADSGVMNVGDDIPAMGAFIKLHVRAPLCRSIVFGVDFKIALRMGADGADLGSIGPDFVFVNKMDQAGADRHRVLAELRGRFGDRFVDFTALSIGDTDGEERAALLEEIAVKDDRLTELYLETGEIPEEEICRLVRERRLCPCCFGSALKDEGVDEFIKVLTAYTREPDLPEIFSARIFKISRGQPRQPSDTYPPYRRTIKDKGYREGLYARRRQ